MEISVCAVDRKVKASAGKHSQVGPPQIDEDSSEYQLLPASLIARTSFNGCLTEAARHSGLEDQEIADAIHISAGYMSRFMRGVAQQWARRMIAFMRTTKSLAPLQKIADELGCDLVPRASNEARIRELEDQIERMKGRQ